MTRGKKLVAIKAIIGNQWQSMAINDNQWQSLAIIGNQEFSETDLSKKLLFCIIDVIILWCRRKRKEVTVTGQTNYRATSNGKGDVLNH